MELYRQTIDNKTKNTDFDAETELSKVVLVNVLFSDKLFGGIRCLRSNNELVLVSAVYNKNGNNFYITIKQLLQYLQETYNECKPCKDLKDIKRCFSACLNDLYEAYGARFLGIDGFCAYLYTKMFKDINDNNQLINVKIKKNNVNINNRNYVRDLYTLDEDSLSNLFSDYCIEFDKNQYLIDEYPISLEEQQKAFDDFVNNYIIIPYNNKDFSGSSDIKGFIHRVFEKKCKSKNQEPYSYKAVQEFDKFFDKEAMVIRYSYVNNKGFLVCNCRFLEGKYLVPHLDVNIIPKIVQSVSTGSKKYCSTCNFLDLTCPFINNYGSCDVMNSSFIVDEGDIYNVKPEAILLFQTGKANKIECGSIITRKVNMKKNFEKNEIELKQGNNNIAINKRSKEDKNINNYGSCDVMNSSFIVDEDDIYNVKPEAILLFQKSEKDKIECGSRITRKVHMKTNFEKNEIELKRSNIGELKENDIAINQQSKEDKKNTSNVSFCDKYFGCGSCFCCNDNNQKQIINNTVNIDVSNSKEPIRILRNLDNNI